MSYFFLQILIQISVSYCKCGFQIIHVGMLIHLRQLWPEISNEQICTFHVRAVDSIKGGIAIHFEKLRTLVGIFVVKPIHNEPGVLEQYRLSVQTVFKCIAPKIINLGTRW